jgi:hypothetical protein
MNRLRSTIVLSMFMLIAATMAVKPEEDFQGYMESIEQREAQAERDRDMLHQHEVCTCAHVCFSALRLFSPLPFAWMIDDCRHVRNGDRKRGVAGRFANCK